MMIILKPSWISHNGMPIFSIDIHPDGTRLATGGQGRDSGLVMLWNTAAVLDENSENDENVPKMLCQVSDCFLVNVGEGVQNVWKSVIKLIMIGKAIIV